ncbi:hypothetical protein TNCV_25431 [Trichonephila clavipes]|uniref:Uncharacterized protein n=1 Tax=Trichonephila clavipes TaxID=2585209 RepID=A0A8X6W1S6_TRICX|nr:hypothetical protein TNCV_25431 [Trichonephila clavipes]
MMKRAIGYNCRSHLEQIEDNLDSVYCIREILSNLMETCLTRLFKVKASTVSRLLLNFSYTTRAVFHHLAALGCSKDMPTTVFKSSSLIP